MAAGAAGPCACRGVRPGCREALGAGPLGCFDEHGRPAGRPAEHMGELMRSSGGDFGVFQRALDALREGPRGISTSSRRPPRGPSGYFNELSTPSERALGVFQRALDLLREGPRGISTSSRPPPGGPSRYFNELSTPARRALGIFQRALDPTGRASACSGGLESPHEGLGLAAVGLGAPLARTRAWSGHRESPGAGTRARVHASRDRERQG
jgi:hypothetical protein